MFDTIRKQVALTSVLVAALGPIDIQDSIQF